MDSLKNVVATAKDGTNKVKLVFEIGEQYKNTVPYAAFYYYLKALKIYEETGDKKQMAILGANKKSI
jgi:hypothetical protein